ncbi:MAG: hypothetical protein U0Q19_10835 [Kineosporiaceae bacterium]
MSNSTPAAAVRQHSTPAASTVGVAPLSAAAAFPLDAAGGGGAGAVPAWSGRRRFGRRRR